MRLIRGPSLSGRENIYRHARRLYPTRDPTGDLRRTDDRSAFETIDPDEAPDVICGGAAMIVAACDLGFFDEFSSDRRPSQDLIGRALLMLNPDLGDTSVMARATRKARHLPEEVDEQALGLCVTRQNDRGSRSRRIRANAPGDTRGAFDRIRKALMFTVANPNAFVTTRKRNRRRAATLVARGAGGGRSGSSTGRHSTADLLVTV